MGDLTFASDRLLASTTPAEVFAMVGRPEAGWLLGLRAERVEVGAAVRFEMPGVGGERHAATGRLRAVEPARRLVLDQETPWRGRITIRFEAEGSGTRLRMLVALAEDCVPWFLGDAPTSVSADGPAVTLGVMASLSGSTGILGRAAVNAAELAVSEVNAGGGIRGVPLRLVVADDRSTPTRAADQCARLIRDARASAIVAMVSSASFRAAAVVARRHQALLVHAPVTEGGCRGRTIFQFGARPRDQLAASIPALMDHYGSRAWYVVGSDYCWPRAVGAVAQEVIDTSGGTLLGQQYLGTGAPDLTGALEAIRSSGAELVLSALVGHDAVRFEQAVHAAGMRGQVRTLATLVDASVLEHIGAAASEGIWSALDQVDPAQDAVAVSWRRAFGTVAPPLSSTALSVYEAVHLYARAAWCARSPQPALVADQLRSGRLGPSRLLARMRGEASPTALAEVVGGVLEVRSPAS